MIYVTSDLHFCHDKPFLYESRGFASIEEHDTAIINNWNRMITDNDIVYCLGDEVLTNTEEGIKKLKRLKGTLHIIRGNHDSDNRAQQYEWLRHVESVSWANVIRYNKFNFYMSHFPTIVNPEHNRTFFNLCGHVHTKDRWLDWDKGCYHVEMDAHDCKPVSIEEIIKDIKNKMASE